MITHYLDTLPERAPQLGETGTRVSLALHDAVLKGGAPARKLADVLHGTWLGHPLHVVLTDITIGAWVSGALFDALALLNGDRRARQAGDTLAAFGTATAVPTLLSGLADYSTFPKPAAAPATLHAVMNDVNFVLYLLSVRARKKGNWKRGVFLSTLGLALTAGSAWLGGHLVYRHRMGADHSDAFSGPEAWTPVLPEAELPEGQAKRVEVEGKPVLLYRKDGIVCAIGSVCSHAGGPLEEGSIDGFAVTCPWHDSVFDLRDGCVRHGPSTHPQPSFAARVREGQIELRLQSSRPPMED